MLFLKVIHRKFESNLFMNESIELNEIHCRRDSCGRSRDSRRSDSGCVWAARARQQNKEYARVYNFPFYFDAFIGLMKYVESVSTFAK